ncbi:MAG: pyruvate kinase [Gammaproteobacteria bacterium]|nr:MAG: pyruvate kinase [Gammaproteobacteria bacterium]
MRRTKIIATVGPATDAPGMLEHMLEAGVDLFRLNYSHQDGGRHEERVARIRELSARLGVETGIIADLQGPKIRIGKFGNGPVTLSEGQAFILDVAAPVVAGDAHRVGVTYPLHEDVKPGHTLLLDDGSIVLKVKEVAGMEIRCKVQVGGELSDNKGINLLGGGLSAPSLTEKDLVDLRHGVKIGVDYFAVSFVRNARDVEETRRQLIRAGSAAGIIAKIERAEAVERAEEIIEAADAIMIARGDLGVEIGDAVLPAIQKNLITLARKKNRPSITATQMMQSMIDNQIPLRAEVFDVANAVLDGTDAVMLSAETSVGKFPDKVVQAMARICEETEKQPVARFSDHRISQNFNRIDEAIAAATMYTANHIGARAIASLTETGTTCRWMSRISSTIPVFGFTRYPETMRRMRLYRGVCPIHFDITHTNPFEANREIIRILREKGYVANGDRVIITKGDLQGIRGGTNNMKIIQVGQSLETDA